MNTEEFNGDVMNREDQQAGKLQVQNGGASKMAASCDGICHAITKMELLTHKHKINRHTQQHNTPRKSSSY